MIRILKRGISCQHKNLPNTDHDPDIETWNSGLTIVQIRYLLTLMFSTYIGIERVAYTRVSIPRRRGIITCAVSVLQSKATRGAARRPRVPRTPSAVHCEHVFHNVYLPHCYIIKCICF